MQKLQIDGSRGPNVNYSGTQQMSDHAGTDRSPRIRVLWLTKSLGFGGIERLLEHIAKGIDTSKFTVECAFADPNYVELVPALEKQGIRVHWLSTCSGDVVWPLRLFSILRRGRFDVVHSHSPILASLARLCILTMARERCPFHITTDHSFWYNYRRITRFLNAATANLDDFSIAVSSEVLRSIVGGVRRKTVVQIQGIELAPLWELRAKAVDMRRLDADTLHLATIANFTAAKDYPTLFSACRILADRGINYRLRVIGAFNAKAEDRVFALCEQLKLSPYLEFCGFRDDIGSLVVSSDIFVIASALDAGPITAMEAAALGLAIVSTKVGIMNEAFTDDEDCLLVPTRDPVALADAIERMANDAALRRRLGKCAFQRSVQFDINRVIGTLEAQYSSLVRQDRFKGPVS